MATILIVEDRPIDRKFLTVLLRSNGHEVVEASDSEEALRLLALAHPPPHLVISDVLMPTVDGYEFVRRMRELRALDATPVIFYTATYHEREARTLARDCGVVDILTKPSEPAAILDKVNAVLESTISSTTFPLEQTRFDQAHLQVVSSALAIKNGHLNASEDRMATIVEVAWQISAERDPRALMETVCTAARDVTLAQHAAIELLAEDARSLSRLVSSGLDDETSRRMTVPPLDTPSVAPVINERRTLRLVNPGGRPEALGLPPGHPPTYSYLAVPIATVDRVYGYLALRNKLGAAEFTEADADVVRALATHAGIAYENVSHAAALELEVTERRCTEMALRRSHAELDGLMAQLREANTRLVLANRLAQMRAEESGHLAAIVESSNDAIIGTTLDGIVTSWNQAAERLFGYTREEIVGRPMSVLVSSDDRDEQSQILERVRQGQRVKRLEATRLGKDGRRTCVALTVSPIRDDEGHITGASTIARDITDVKQAEQERARLFGRERHARAEAETATRLKDEFLATVSHELRTPLNAVLGWARMLRSGQLTDAHAADALETIERNAASLALIIEDLLDVSRIVAGTLSLASHPVDLIAVTQATLDEVGPAAAARHIHLQFSADPASIELVEGDAGRLQQVISNLLINAVKFTPEGGRVDVSVARARSQMEVKVVDTGQGIEADFLPHVFERFRQADGATTRQHGGLGLGLAIVRQLVELHGGSVHAASEGKGRGASFTVCLPIPGADAQVERRPSLYRERRSAELKASPKPRAQELHDLRILVVDDDTDGRTLTALLLKQAGASVDMVASASEAREALLDREARRPDVLVSDIGLPDEDGYGLLRQIRQQEAEHGGFLPAIALTGYARAEDRTRALAAGFQAHVVKPIEPAVLIAAIAAFAPESTRPEGRSTEETPPWTTVSERPSSTAETAGRQDPQGRDFDRNR